MNFFFSIVLVESLCTGGKCPSWPCKLLTIPRDKLRGNLLLKQHLLEVDLRHVSLYNDELAHAIQDRPSDVLPLVRVLFS